jgi:hypothetical protein
MKPESLKTIKCNFQSILRKDVDYSKLFGCVERANGLTFAGYNLLKLHLLKLFKDGEELPKITNEYVKRIFKVLSLKSCGPKNKNSLGNLEKICEKFMKSAGLENKFNATNLSYILNEEETKIVTSYTNNIKINFQKYLFQFVNEIYKVPRRIKKSKEEFLKLSVEEKLKYKLENTELSKQRKEKLEELKSVKKDLLMCTLESDSKYHKSIKFIRRDVFPKIKKKTLLDDVECFPFKYLKSMLLMNETLEEKNLKMFQTLPLRTDLSIKYVSLNTGAIKDIFGEIKSDKSKELSNAEIWKKYFNINPKKYKIKGYDFDELIQTDGTAVSIIFMKHGEFIRKKQVHTKMAKASKEGKKNIKTMTKVQLEQHKKKTELVKQKYTEKQQENASARKEAFKKLPKEEQEEIKLQMRLKQEFVYINEAIKDEKLREHLLNQLKKNKIIVVDPGKRSILTMLGEKGIYNYRSRRRIKETKRLKYNRLRLNKFNDLLKDTHVKKLNNALTETSHKTTKVGVFMKYIETKYGMIAKIGSTKMKIFSNYVNKLKWHAYINKKRHEDNILNEIEEKYGSDATIVIGDWSASDHIKGMSSPNMGIKRVLNKRFEVFLVDEFKSTILNYLTKEKMEHLKLLMEIKDGNGVVVKSYLKEMYSIFTYKMSNKNLGCINRDRNATLNMKNIVESIIKGNGRPKEFQRNTKLKKSSNQ